MTRTGRPRLAAARRRAVTVKLTDAEYALYKAAADEQVLALGVWIREACEMRVRGSTR